MDAWRDKEKVEAFKNNHENTEMSAAPALLDENGCTYRLFFDNEYGVSIVWHKDSCGYSQGLYELAAFWHYDSIYRPGNRSINLIHINPFLDIDEDDIDEYGFDDDEIVGYLTIEEALEIAEKVYNYGRN